MNPADQIGIAVIKYDDDFFVRSIETLLYSPILQSMPAIVSKISRNCRTIKTKNADTLDLSKEKKCQT